MHVSINHSTPNCYLGYCKWIFLFSEDILNIDKLEQTVAFHHCSVSGYVFIGCMSRLLCKV